MKLIDQKICCKKNADQGLLLNTILKGLFLLATIIWTYLCLAILLYRIFTQGIGYLDWQFLQSFASRKPEEAGIKAALIGTHLVDGCCCTSFYISWFGTAIYLEEYAKNNWFTRFIKMNISNLAGVPSIVFGLLGLTIFVRALALERSCIGCWFDDESYWFYQLLLLPLKKRFVPFLVNYGMLRMVWVQQNGRPFFVLFYQLLFQEF